MEISRESVLHIAELSRLALTEEELSRMQRELADILTYMKTIDELTHDGAEPTAGAPLSNITRADEIAPSADRELLLKNAPHHTDETIVVPKTVE